MFCSMWLWLCVDGFFFWLNDVEYAGHGGWVL